MRMTLIDKPAFRATAILVAAALAPLAVPAGARAADSPWYLGFQVPVMFIDGTESEVTGRNVSLDPRVPPGTMLPYSGRATPEYDVGFKIAGMVGYKLGVGLRVEGELFFSRANVDKQTYDNVTLGGQPVAGLGKVDVPVSGSAEQAGALANVWFDIPTGSDWIPYIGGGGGFIRIDQGGLEYDDDLLTRQVTNHLQGPEAAARVPPGFVPQISSSDTQFAWHIGAGVGYRLNDRTTLQFGYRLQTARDFEFDGRNASNGNSIEVKTEFRAHLFETGVRTTF